MTTLHLRNLISRSPLRRGLLFIAVALACFGLSPVPNAFGVSPPPDGGYPNANTAEGDSALFSLTSGANNTANGYAALLSNTTGSNNTANGVVALLSNTTGNDNTANGFAALEDNNGDNNTANGYFALLINTTGIDNTANGVSALQNNTTGNFNTATGLNALLNNTTGSANTTNGVAALAFNTTGTDNTANGVAALLHNTTGSGNIALGSSAGSTLTTGSNNIDIGNGGVAGEAAKIRIGTAGNQTAAFIAGIRGVAVTGAAVVVSSSGQLGVAPSSARFKDEIKPMDKASEAILALKPVTFRYKHELDPDGIPQFGLVAEEVEKVNPDLVARDAQGKVYTVRYEAVNAMLLNEFLKEHRTVQEQDRKVEDQGRKEHEDEATISQLRSTLAKQEATISQLKSTVAQQQKDFQGTIAQQQSEIKALTIGVQKVSDQLELSKRTPQLAAINE